MPYNPALHILASDAIGFSNGTPSDARSKFYDEVLIAYRPFADLQEVIDYFPNLIDRDGHFPIIVIVDGVEEVYMFRGGVQEENLVPASEGGGLEQFPTIGDFPAEGKENKLYLAKDTVTLYFWDGTTFQPITGEQLYIKNQDSTDQAASWWINGSAAIGPYHEPLPGRLTISGATGELTFNGREQSAFVQTPLAGERWSINSASGKLNIFSNTLKVQVLANGDLIVGSGSDNGARLQIQGGALSLATNPADFAILDGSLYYNGGLKKLKACIDGAWKNIATEDQIPAPINAILNQIAAAQVANFWIDGTGKVDTLNASRQLEVGPSGNNRIMWLDGAVTILSDVVHMGDVGGNNRAHFIKYASGNIGMWGNTTEGGDQGHRLFINGAVAFKGANADEFAANPAHGAIFYRADLAKLRACINGIWKNIATEDQLPNAILNQIAAAQAANFWINGTGIANELDANKFSFPNTLGMSITSDGVQLIMDCWTNSRGFSFRAGGQEFAHLLRGGAGESLYFFRIIGAFDIRTNTPYGVGDNMGSMNLYISNNPAGWNQLRIKGYDINPSSDARWSLAHKIVLYHPNTGVQGDQDNVKGIGIGSSTTHMHFSVPDNGGFAYYGGPVLPTQSVADFAIQNGGISFRTDTQKFRVGINGAWQNIATEGVLIASKTVVVDNTHPAATDNRTGLSNYSTSAPFLTIQAAVNALAYKDTLLIRNGTYIENVAANLNGFFTVIYENTVHQSTTGTTFFWTSRDGGGFKLFLRNSIIAAAGNPGDLNAEAAVRLHGEGSGSVLVVGDNISSIQCTDGVALIMRTTTRPDARNLVLLSTNYFGFTCESTQGTLRDCDITSTTGTACYAMWLIRCKVRGAVHGLQLPGNLRTSYLRAENCYIEGTTGNAVAGGASGGPETDPAGGWLKGCTTKSANEAVVLNAGGGFDHILYFERCTFEITGAATHALTIPTVGDPTSVLDIYSCRSSKPMVAAPPPYQYNDLQNIIDPFTKARTQF